MTAKAFYEFPKFCKPGIGLQNLSKVKISNYLTAKAAALRENL